MASVVNPWMTLVCVAAAALAAPPRAGSRLADLLLWGADVATIDPATYPPEVTGELGPYLSRWRAYRSHRIQPQARDRRMVYEAEVRYERRMAALSSSPQAAALAAAYVDGLHPCYEWEGLHDCPEREAYFARGYRKDHSDSLFRDYLPLLEAHRFLCAAESYETELRPESAARCRREYGLALDEARRSRSGMVRQAADELAARGTCFAVTAAPPHGRSSAPTPR